MASATKRGGGTRVRSAASGAAEPSPADVRDYPEAVMAARGHGGEAEGADPLDLDLGGRQAAIPGRTTTVDELFAGDRYAAARAAIKASGVYHAKGSNKALHVQTRPIEGSDDHEIMAIAAVSRDPGLTQDYVNLVPDFFNKTSSNRAKTIQQYWNIYKSEGLINNAVNKYASLLSVGGHFKVRNAKKGKAQKATLIAQAVLDHWIRAVNGSALDSVASSARGCKALVEQGMRVALVEGNYIGREVWGKHDVSNGEAVGQFSLPMTIQTLSMEFMEPVPGLQGLGDLWYWSPSADTKKLITEGGGKDAPKEVKALVKRLFDNEVTKQVKKNGKALLDPSLLLTVKHRGSDREAEGESFIEPAKLGIRYARAVTATDTVAMENVISQLTVVLVGSSDPASPYSKADVAAARTALMQQFFEEPGPTMTIVWQGDDVRIEKVKAMDAMIDLSGQHKVGERKMIIALGIPSALLDGTASDGKAAGWASLIAASGMAEHLCTGFATTLTQLGERILLENGFTELDIVFEFDRSNLGDKSEERNQNRNDYAYGLLSIKDMLLAMGKDPDAQFAQKCFEKGLDAATTTWEEAFMPPQGLQGQSDGGVQGQGPGKTPGNGKPSDSTTGKPTQAPAEKTTPKENK